MSFSTEVLLRGGVGGGVVRRLLLSEAVMMLELFSEQGDPLSCITNS